MPELPEVETIVRQLKKPLKNRFLSDVKVYDKKVVRPHKIGDFEAVLKGKQILGLRRRGKLIIIPLSDDKFLAIHLKMTGQLVVDGQLGKHTRAMFVLDDGRKLLYNDLRKFGFLNLYDRSQLDYLLEERFNFGPEPLSNDFDPQVLAESLKDRKASVKSLLLDQSIVAGLGNIYVDEVLHQAGVHPSRPAGSVSPKEIEKIHKATVRILTAALEAGGSSSKDYIDAKGNQGNFQNFHKVYGRKGLACKKCKDEIKRIVIAGRGTHFCPSCQI